MLVLICTRTYDAKKLDFPPISEIWEEAPCKQIHEGHRVKMHFLHQVDT